MLNATFAAPDLTTFCRLDELGLKAIGQEVTPDEAVLACEVVEPDSWCRRCGSQGAARDTVIRKLAHEPVGWRPTRLLIRVRRYRCTGCAHVWRQDTSKAAEPLRETLPPWPALGTDRHRLSAPHRGPGRFRASGCRGTPPTVRSWPKASGS